MQWQLQRGRRSVAQRILAGGVASPRCHPPTVRPPLPQGADIVEGQKLYARIFRALSSLGIRI